PRSTRRRRRRGAHFTQGRDLRSGRDAPRLPALPRPGRLERPRAAAEPARHDLGRARRAPAGRARARRPAAARRVEPRVGGRLAGLRAGPPAGRFRRPGPQPVGLVVFSAARPRIRGRVVRLTAPPVWLGADDAVEAVAALLEEMAAAARGLVPFDGLAVSAFGPLASDANLVTLAVLARN